jgi:uroporphyrinogen III methyltransferase/synthase
MSRRAISALAGKRVLVTRTLEQAGSTASLLRERGAEPVLVPTIEIHPPTDSAPLARAVGALATAYDWVAFTSANAVSETVREVVRQGLNARAFGAVKVAAVGPGTAAALAAHGVHADLGPKEFRGEGLAQAMLKELAPGSRVLVPRAKEAREVLPNALRAAGMQVEVVTAYETRKPPPETVARLMALLEKGSLDAVMFTSGSTVDNLCDLLGERAESLLARVTVASIGPVTTAAAERRGVRVDATASEATVLGLVLALEARFVRPAV